MKIAIEAQRIFRSNKHGMDFVALETIRELQKRDDGNEYYILVAPGEDRCLTESHNLFIVEINCPTYPLWEQVALPRAVKRIGADLLHCTLQYCPSLVSCSIGTDLARYHLLRTPTASQPLTLSGNGMVLSSTGGTRILKKCKKNHYRISFRMRTYPQSVEYSCRTHHGHLQWI